MNGKLIKTEKIGIFGGSFDPVHLGHTGLAADAVKQAGLDKVVFVPAKLQPFKLDKKLTSGDARLDMLRLATADMDNVEISSYELDAEGISYSYLTMRAMQGKYGEAAKLYFITGTDAFLKLDTWMNAEELLTSYSYVIGTRPGYKQEELDAFIDKQRRKYGTEIININNTQIDVSSTEIRDMLRAGKSAADLISGEVERYIRENGLYE